MVDAATVDKLTRLLLIADHNELRYQRRVDIAGLGEFVEGALVDLKASLIITAQVRELSKFLEGVECRVWCLDRDFQRLARFLVSTEIELDVMVEETQCGLVTHRSAQMRFDDP